MSAVDSFLQRCLAYIRAERPDFLGQHWIVPTEKTARILHHLLLQQEGSRFLPRILTMDQCVEQLSGQFVGASDWPFLRFFYNTHCGISSQVDKQSFVQFFSIARTLLADFNQIDLHCVDPKQIFRNISAYQALEHFLEPEQTWAFASDQKTSDWQNKFIHLWEQLPLYYEDFQRQMCGAQQFTQASLWRSMAENGTSLINELEESDYFYFIGLSAIPPAQRAVIKALASRDKAQVLCNMDQSMLGTYSGVFWDDLVSKNFGPEDLINTTPKEIYTVTTLTAIQQAETVGQIIHQWQREEPAARKAVLVCDEQLILALEQYLMEESAVNISSGFAMRHDHFFHWMQALFRFVQTSQQEHWLFVSQSPVAAPYFGQGVELTHELGQLLSPFCTGVAQPADLENLLLFFTATDYAEVASAFWKKNQQMQRSLQGLAVPFDKYCEWLEQQVQHDRLSFLGDFFEDTQIMGVLESRALDFDCIAFVNFEEEIFPPHHFSASFIPNSVKRYFHIPTLDQQNHLYAYQFYRLMMRARKIYFIYNANQQSGSGELSRFAQQLEWSLPLQNPRVNWTNTVRGMQVENVSPKSIVWSAQLREQISTHLRQRGISPTSLIALCDCPANFYYQYVLRLAQEEPDPRVMQPNQLGELVHYFLFQLYQPYLQKNIDAQALRQIAIDFERYAADWTQSWRATAAPQLTNSGKNQLSLALAQAMVQKWVQYEQQQFCEPYFLQALEYKVTRSLSLAHGQEVVLNGVIDRLQRVRDRWQIIDYKTGTVRAESLKLPPDPMDLWLPQQQWKSSKVNGYPIQLLFYAYLQQGVDAEVGIYSLPKLEEQGFLKLSEETVQTWLVHFEQGLKEKLQRLLAGEIPIAHRKDAPYCVFCN